MTGNNVMSEQYDLGDIDFDTLDKLELSRNGLTGFEMYYPRVSRNPEIKNIYNLIKKVAKSNASVLIQGETGTGKELIAGSIQAQSLRVDKPFITVNCAALHENLLESELFGHEKGAFTGAISTHNGKFEQADGGTLFLDEIGDMHPSTQAKILRVLQEQTFNRVGSNKTLRVDVRIIAATNKDLGRDIEEGRFRPDLYYRLNVVPLHVPALRERKEDIPMLAEYFRRKFSEELKKEIGGFTRDALELLEHHNWPGNIRELRNIIERAALVVGDQRKITPEVLTMSGKDYFGSGGMERRSSDRTGTNFKSLNLEAIEKEAIIVALQRTRWVQKLAADMLGISPRALNYKISQHNITYHSWRKHS